MIEWIGSDYEKNIKLWYKKVRAGEEDTLFLRLKENNDFFALQNFFLICMKTNKRLNLRISCPSKTNEFRIRHYIYACWHLANEIRINNSIVKKVTAVEFFRILPLIPIDKMSYRFLASRIEDIEKKWKKSIGTEMLEWLKHVEETESDYKVRCVEVPGHEERALMILALTGLYGEVRGISNLTKARRRHFADEKFKERVKNIPFLTFLIFSLFDRIKHVEIANGYKEKKRQKEKQARVILKEREMPEALPKDEDIIADLFTAWDFSDGILQLLENIVEHAGTDRNGTGTLSIRIHTYANDEKYLKENYDQYFKGYENSYRKEYEKIVDEKCIVDCTEKQYFRECHGELYEQLKKGRFVEKSIIEDYEKVRKKIETRRNRRSKPECFLDIQIADISGSNICDVFKQNLIKQEYKDNNDFENINVRSFFDPNHAERRIFQKYYRGQNIVHHYGLQIFASIVVNNDGYFYVRSHSEEKNGRDMIYDTTREPVEISELDLKDAMEGTRYQILLPFRRQNVQERNSTVNVNVSYHTRLLEDWNIIEKTNNDNFDIFYKELRDYKGEKQTKENIVSVLSGYLRKMNASELSIVVFDMNNIAADKIEIFCKALIRYIATGAERDNIAILNCSTENFVSIVRIFSVCYDKNGMSNWMGDSQVYLCGKDTLQEFLISGGDIHTLLTRVEKLAFSRKIHPMCIQIMRKILEKKQNVGEPYTIDSSEEKKFEYTPFDLLLKKDKLTFFENNVKNILNNDIQKIESGCRIEPTHMRLGSKIHINIFYEAELLFYNNYYTSRFSSLLLKKLEKIIERDNKKIDEKSPICLVGYDTYSEMLLCEMKSMLQKRFGIECPYVVYEVRKTKGVNLRYLESVQPGMQGVIIVPINSTLTTFNKVHAELQKELKRTDRFLPIIGYMGIIQVLDDDKRNTESHLTKCEEMYWDSIDFKGRCISSKKLLGAKSADYLIEIKSKWSDPQKCNQCFPTDCLFETPLIETDKSSVVPTQLIGLKEKFSDSKKKIPGWKSGDGKVEELRDFFYHGHIVRGDNHFCYYIRTAAYYQKYKEKIKNWLKETVRLEILKKEKDDSIVFSVIVAPMHFSNTAFVEAVNENVFEGASYVLRIESEKEFRDNIQTKYSDLTALYRNLLITGNRAVINFYFVDDNIITGKSFYRIKHLVKSLFSKHSQNMVRVNIFKSVIVLLNRLSPFSITNYAEDINDYFAYLNLNISNLRSFEDACFLCKRASDNQKLAEYSSTNAINKHWVDKKEKYKLKTLTEIKNEFLEEKGSIRVERLFKRMLATHRINDRLTELDNSKNNTVKVYEAIVNAILEEIDSPKEMLTAYIYAVAYPFVVYRKSCREAVFRMPIILFELFINKETKGRLLKRIDEGEDMNSISETAADELRFMVNKSMKLNKIIQAIERADQEEFLLFLIKVSVELRCNYIIRPDRIECVLKKYFKLTSEDELFAEKRKKFIIYFTAMVKKLLSLSSDSSKITYFEKYIYDKLKRLQDKRKEVEKNAFSQYLYEVYLALFLENTGGLLDAVKDLRTVPGNNQISLEGYYLDNYMETLKINEVEDQQNLSKNFVDVYKYLDNNQSNLENGKNQLEGDSHKNIEYYNQLAGKIRNLTEAHRVQFLFSHEEETLKIHENDDNRVKFDKKIRKYDAFSCNVDEHLIIEEEQIEKLRKKIKLDTLAFDGKYALIVYVRNRDKEEEGENSYFEPIYLLLEYNEEIKFKQLTQIRRVLVFRNMMLRQFQRDFENNVIQTWIEQLRVLKQLEKARAFVHAKNFAVDDKSNVWNMCEGFFYGRPIDIENHKKEFGKYQEGCIFELMTDIRIGRINLLLLSNSEFQTDSNSGRHLFRLAKEHIEGIKKTKYWESICICDQNNKPITGQSVIPENIYAEELEKNNNGRYNRVNKYLSYLISETIHSAKLYGERENDKKVHISIYKEAEYLYICNKIKGIIDDQKKRIEDGLARKGNGISLAVVCEYFIKQYKERYVKISIEDEFFKIGLPIFKN